MVSCRLAPVQEGEVMETPQSRLVAVSNRLPIKLVGHGVDVKVEPGSGGLVTAMAPVLRNRGGLWIGWSGSTDDSTISGLMAEASRQSGYSLHLVSLTREEVRDYYYGFSNEIVWPLFHDLQTRCNFRPQYWYQYLNVNKKFADVIIQNTRLSDFVWVHDYHLMHVAHFLKDYGLSNRLGFFLHIPFPPMDIFMKLPWREKIIKALLDYDLVGFQTIRDRRHFTMCVQRFVPEARLHGRGGVITIRLPDREVRVGVFPISIDFHNFAEDASSKEVADCAWFLHEKFPDMQIVLGIDRLDYTKGIPERFEAFKTTLLRYPELREKITLVQVVVPSREEVEEYRALKGEIERLVGEINGLLSTSGWIPIHYLYKHLSRRDLLAYYRLAEIALVTPLKDGMNLVAKEYCTCNLEENGVLILSEFAGAASQLHKGAILVNPYDVEGISDAIYTAFHMEKGERARRMRWLREHIRRRDIFWWVNTYLKAALSKDLADFPELEDISSGA